MCSNLQVHVVQIAFQHKDIICHHLPYGIAEENENIVEVLHLLFKF